MAPVQSVWLSKVQRELLQQIATFRYEEGHINPRFRRSADILVRAGLARSRGRGWYAITDAGKRAIES